jgi:hypothetical protein
MSASTSSDLLPLLFTQMRSELGRRNCAAFAQLLDAIELHAAAKENAELLRICRHYRLLAAQDLTVC